MSLLELDRLTRRFGGLTAVSAAERETASSL